MKIKWVVLLLVIVGAAGFLFGKLGSSKDNNQKVEKAVNEKNSEAENEEETESKDEARDLLEKMAELGEDREHHFYYDMDIMVGETVYTPEYDDTVDDNPSAESLYEKVLDIVKSNSDIFKSVKEEVPSEWDNPYIGDYIEANKNRSDTFVFEYINNTTCERMVENDLLVDSEVWDDYTIRKAYHDYNNHEHYYIIDQTHGKFHQINMFCVIGHNYIRYQGKCNDKEEEDQCFMPVVELFKENGLYKEN